MVLKQHQPPMTIDEQIENLKSLGLIIDDEERAKGFLNDVSYFRLIKAFGLGLKQNDSKYIKDTTFDEIVELYLFNANFRQLLFAQIERVEINLRCRLGNYFSLTYGNFGYEDKNNFRNEDYYNLTMLEIQKEISRSDKVPFVQNFQNNYVDGKIPMYALVELFSFGTLSKFFKNMQNIDKKAIASSYGVGYTYFESWIEYISFIRNVSAHYGRLYNINFSKTPILYRQYTQKGIGNIRVYAVLLCLKHLLPNDRHWYEFVDTVELLFDKYPNVRKELMGFPKDDWKDFLLSK